jgi:hypothetical protein
MNLIDILLVVLIVLASALCIYSIIALRKMVQSVEAIRTDVKEFVEVAYPAIENITEISRKANRIISEAETHWDDLDRSIRRVKEKVADLTSFSFVRNAENPAKDLIRNLKAIFKGITSFWQTYKSY